MARIKGNNIMLNVRGMINNQVVSKSRKGTDYLAGRPSVNKRRKISRAENGNRDRFAAATRYAKHVILDAGVKAFYESLAKGGQSAYNVAFKDAFHGPQITAVFTHGYKGNVGDTILIQARDNYKVTKVTVSIYGDAKKLIEYGEAVDNGDGFNFLYAATVSNSSNCLIEVHAFDLPVNVATETKTVSFT